MASPTLLLVWFLVLATAASAFTTPPTTRSRRTPTGRSVAVEDDVEIRFDEDENEPESNDDSVEAARRRRARWEQLDPKYKQYLIQKGQERAIANKQKTTPAQDQKRKLMMFVKQQQRNKKRQAKIERPFSVGSPDRTPLQDIQVGSEREGTVISLTNFGAYVDIGTTVDGLLHVSQISTDVFVEHPRQILSPGDRIVVRVRSTNPERNKMHLTMLPWELVQAQQNDQETAHERIELEAIQIDDELWGQLKRVTDFGAYVEVGAAVDGWLHFMDHPSWDGTMHPSEFMARGDRVRVWVSDVDRTQKRLKLTANRPSHLPGPRREFL
jgi:predicted RNA-binding protein with RPS1 domain